MILYKLLNNVILTNDKVVEHASEHAAEAGEHASGDGQAHIPNILTFINESFQYPRPATVGIELNGISHLLDHF